jgi:uncharacterized protein
VIFEWNADKAARNAANHQGVTFEEAATVFNDARVLIEPDYDHSEYEQRFWAIGFSEQGRILLVVFTYRGESIHLISARKATPRERTDYGNQID